MVKPSPSPALESFVVKNGSNKRDRRSGGMPVPLSRTVIDTRVPSVVTLTSIRRVGHCPTASTAFVSKLTSTCSSRLGVALHKQLFLRKVLVQRDILGLQLLLNEEQRAG